MGSRSGQAFDVIENSWIPLSDGTRLAARIWMPRGSEKKPVPAVLEYIPYRKRDGTSVRDEATYPGLAEAGYAGVRVDIRGNGDSDGLWDDEYSPRELADAVEVIGWIARQPWCTGAVGMMGISWGGFNCLQVAALRPPALKAVISLSSTVDRYNDDIHYKNGCHLSANLSWSTVMLCYASRPPDPAIVGERWRDMWLERLKHEPFPLATWLRHQTRDSYWRHGSICENFEAIEAAVLIIAGWADGYKNAPPAAVAGLKAPAKAINGPWIHKYPHFAWPKPRVDFHAEAIRWWDRWLKGKKNGAERLPAYRAYITEQVRPGPLRQHDPGRWVAEKLWPSPRIKPRVLHLNAGGALAKRPDKAATVTLCSPQDLGTMAGEFFTLKPDAELAQDQRADDAGALVFETEVLKEPLEVLGRPELTLAVAIDAPFGNLIARLIDVLPDGTEYRVSFGMLNLAHRNGHAAPEPMTPGKAETVTMRLDECGHRFHAGNRLRIAISTAYWPMVLPPPRAVTAQLELGSSARLTLPLRKGGDRIDIPEPANPDPLPKYREVAPPRTRRWVERDLSAGLTRYHIEEDFGGYEIPAADGLIAHETRHETYTIAPDDPLRAVSECRWTATRRRDSWTTRTEAWSRLTADATHFHIEARVEAFEGTEKVHEKRWNEKIERTLM